MKTWKSKTSYTRISKNGTPHQVSPHKQRYSNIKQSDIFVVQKHQAERAGLHYDFRLQSNNVLKSWVLKKKNKQGQIMVPPLTKGDKRLAIPQEDHPLSWASFEGRIIEGRGKGTVEIWDKGRVKWIKRTGNMKFILNGKKMKGTYVLIPFKGKHLLFKIRD